jgi:Transposase IS66 family
VARPNDAPLVEVACWSHVRRKFYDVHHAVASATALEAMQRNAALFAIESRIRGQSPERRLAVRQQFARPLLDQLKEFLDTGSAGSVARVRSHRPSAMPCRDGRRSNVT